MLYRCLEGYGLISVKTILNTEPQFIAYITHFRIFGAQRNMILYVGLCTVYWKPELSEGIDETLKVMISFRKGLYYFKLLTSSFFVE